MLCAKIDGDQCYIREYLIISQKSLLRCQSGRVFSAWRVSRHTGRDVRKDYIDVDFELFQVEVLVLLDLEDSA